MAKRSGNKVLLSFIQNAICNNYMANLSDYAKAMEYALKSLHSAEEANDSLSLINSWMTLGNI